MNLDGVRYFKRLTLMGIDGKMMMLSFPLSDTEPAEPTEPFFQIVYGFMSYNDVVFGPFLT